MRHSSPARPTSRRGRLSRRTLGIALAGGLAIVLAGGVATAFAAHRDSPRRDSSQALGTSGPHERRTGAKHPAHPSQTPTASATSTASPSTSSPATVSASASASPTTAVPSTQQSAKALYGSVVDAADGAPPKDQPPAQLPKRADGMVTAAGGTYQGPQAGFIGGQFVMMHRGDHVTLTGHGYVRVRYEIAWFNRPGDMVMPTWTGLEGELFHVASGGQRRMDDAKPGADAAYTWMGAPVAGSSGPAAGYVVLPAGAQQMWQNEFFYLDGTVTLNNNERGADYNITATPMSWADVEADIAMASPADPVAKGWVRYGLVRDTGGEDTPVPQYLTRAQPADPAQVAQRSSVLK